MAESLSKKGNPKNVGVIFIEDSERRRNAEPHLDFDQYACAYFLTQMNAAQVLFVFNIMTLDLTNNPTSNKQYRLPAPGADLFAWLDNLVTTIRDVFKDPKIDYWGSNLTKF